MSMNQTPVSTSSSPPLNSERLVAWVFGGLTVLFILFIVYASWTPADGGAGAGGLFDKLKNPREMFRGHNLRDIATNVLLYMPLGVFLALARSARGGRFLSPWLLGGFAVSLTMELGQSFIGRTPDMVDLITNTSGYVLGYWIIVAAIRFYGLNPLVFMGFHEGETQDRKTQSIAAFRFIGICVYVLIALLPFDVSVKLSDLYAQLQPDETGVPKIILDPLYSVSHWKESGLKLTFELWALLPVAGLTAFLAGIRGRLNVFSPVFACVAVAVFCEGAQICILSRRTDIAMLGVAVLSGVLGWALVRTWFKIQGTQVRSDGSSAEVRWQQLALATLGYAFVIGLFAWSPFQFETELGTVFEKIRHESNLMPFKQHFATRSLGSAVDIVKEAGLFLPLGLLFAKLLTSIRPEFSRLQTVLITGFFCGSFACFTELSQALVVGRYIDVTDVFLGAFGGICGAVVLQLFEVRMHGDEHQEQGQQLAYQQHGQPNAYQQQQGQGHAQQQPQAHQQPNAYQQQQPQAYQQPQAHQQPNAYQQPQAYQQSQQPQAYQQSHEQLLQQQRQQQQQQYEQQQHYEQQQQRAHNATQPAQPRRAEIYTPPDPKKKP